MCEYINGTIIQEDFSMEKYIFDEGNGLWYELRGDYYIPCLAVPAQEERPIGIWGRRHLQYIKKEDIKIFLFRIVEQECFSGGIGFNLDNPILSPFLHECCNVL